MLVVTPSLAMQGFSPLVYSDSEHIFSFGAEAVKYISLAHAVLRAVMFGWGIALMAVVRTLFAQGNAIGWNNRMEHHRNFSWSLVYS